MKELEFGGASPCISGRDVWRDSSAVKLFRILGSMFDISSI